MDHLQALLVQAEPWLRAYGYPVLFVSILVEGLGIPAPGQTLLIAASLLAGKGEMNPVLLMPCALLATLLGDNLGYWLGRSGGRRLLLRLGVAPTRLSRLARLYRRHGVWPVPFNRFFDGPRQLGGLLAGTALMAWPVFFVVDALGGVAWVSLWVVGPIEMEAHGAALHHLWSAINPVVMCLTVGGLLYFGIRYWRRRDTACHHAGRERGAGWPDTGVR